MALSPQERTWVQLQENLRRKRQIHSRHEDQQSRQYNRYKKAPAVPLPRIVDWPSDTPLRGSHYPVIPPVANDRYFNDDTFSLQNYNSEIGQSDDFHDLPLYSSSQPPSPPYPHNGIVRGHYVRQPSNRDPWNASTRVRGEQRPFMQPHDSFVGYSSRLPGRHSQMRVDGGGHRRRGAGRGRGPRVRGFHGRHVWRDPAEEDYLAEESATVVQRHYRGYRTRKNLELMQHLKNPSFAVSFMHHFLRDVLQNDLILDIACEVLVEERARRPKPRETRRSDVNRLTIRYSASDDPSFWEEALDKPEIHKPVAASLMLEVIYEETRVVMTESINELLDDYFETKSIADATNMVMTEVIVDMIPALFEESKMDVAMEMVIDDIIDVETQACVGRFLQETFVRGVMPLDTTEEHLEIREVARVAESSLLETTILDHLLLALVLNRQIWSSVEYTDRFLDDQLLEILLGQYVGILHNRRATEECVPLKRFHEKVITEVALDTILSELTEQLQEDLEDLDEYERG